MAWIPITDGGDPELTTAGELIEDEIEVGKTYTFTVFDSPPAPLSKVWFVITTQQAYDDAGDGTKLATIEAIPMDASPELSREFTMPDVTSGTVVRLGFVGDDPDTSLIEETWGAGGSSFTVK